MKFMLFYRIDAMAESLARLFVMLLAPALLVGGCIGFANYGAYFVGLAVNSASWQWVWVLPALAILGYAFRVLFFVTALILKGADAQLPG